MQIYNFFTDVPLEDIMRFVIKYKIDENILLQYYESFVKELYPNRELEEMLRDVI